MKILGNRPVLPKEVSEFLKHYFPQNKEATREFDYIGIVEMQEDVDNAVDHGGTVVFSKS